jgi:hypothetical protein
METMKKKAEEMLNEIWRIFNDYGGYEYNDSMLYQCEGASTSWMEAEQDEDWDGLVKEYKPCLEYMRHIQKIRILQESLPNEIYS